jgi:hypothetical protein
MKVIQNPHQLPEQTKRRVEKVKIKCENCESVLEDEDYT